MNIPMPVLGITVGDPSGIGPEIALTATRKLGEKHRCILYADEQVLRKSASCVNETREFNIIEDPKDYVPGKINLVHVGSMKADYEFRKVQAACGQAAYDYVARAIHDALENRIDAVVTGPLNKEALNLAGLHYAGHTEIFAKLTGTQDYAMLLTGGELRVIHVSTHVALREACDRAKKKRVLTTIRLGHEAAQALADIAEPRIAVAGLNPHSGEGGLFGTEEIDEIIPAIQEAQEMGINAIGPVPPDTVYMRAVKGEYDMVVAMYHDQGHIPLKIVDFMGGVNITVGLPIIRTSVDHGTAFGRAGQGRADDTSMIAAIEAGTKLGRARLAKKMQMNAPRFVVVADDLTGANDTGVQFHKHGFSSMVSIGGISSQPAKTLVLDTESRNIPAPEAAAIVANLGAKLKNYGGTSIFYKKVDSTMRGNLAAEAAALAKALDLHYIVFTPAFPRNGRIVRDNLLYLDGVPVAETSIARDPRKPVISSALNDVLAQDPALKPQAIRLEQLRTTGLVATMLQEPGCYACDAESDEDLRMLVAETLKTRNAHEVLWMGSAGLAAAMLQELGESISPAHSVVLPTEHSTPKTPAIALVGSVHQKNRDQIAHVLAAGQGTLIQLNMEAFMANPEEESQRLIEASCKVLESGQNLMLASSMNDKDIKQGQSIAVAAFLGGLIHKLLDCSTARGVFVTGGDTAIAMLESLGCNTTRIEREVEMGVPLVSLVGGARDGLHVITKAGAFGKEDTLLNCLKLL